PVPPLRAAGVRPRPQAARRPRPGRGRGAGDLHLDLAFGGALSARAGPRRTMALRDRAQRDRRPGPCPPGAARGASGRAFARTRPAGARRAGRAVLAGAPGPVRPSRPRAERARARVLEWALSERDRLVP